MQALESSERVVKTLRTSSVQAGAREYRAKSARLGSAAALYDTEARAHCACGRGNAFHEVIARAEFSGSAPAAGALIVRARNPYQQRRVVKRMETS